MRTIALVLGLVAALTARAHAVENCSAYLDAYNQNPQAVDNDETLYKAAKCFEGGKALGAALQAYEMVLKYYPKSPLAAHATAATGRIYERIGMFDRAAARFEDYAKRYAGEKDAKDAMWDAAQLRGAIGDADKRIEDTKYFVRTWGAKAPKEAADAMYALADVYDAPDDQLKALRDFVKTYGSHADHGVLAAAYGRIGDLLWRKSCPVMPVDGLCVKVVRDGTPRCDPNELKLAAVARTPALRTEALQAYAQAIALDGGGNDIATRHVAAMAKIARADDDLERLIEKPFPTGLDFGASAKQASTKRFNDWLADETKTAEVLNRQYEAVLMMKDASSSIAAAARLGQITHTFARALVVGEIPKDVRTGEFAKDKQQAYCDAMKQAAEPLLQRSATAFGVCLTKGTELGVFDGWAALCRAEGRAIDPKNFPILGIVADVTVSFEPALEPELPGQTVQPCGKISANQKSADSLYMAGLGYHRCGKLDDARRAYEAALAIAPTHAASQSNLGELLWRAGKHDEAARYWEAALKLNGKLFAAHVDLAIADYERLRALPARDPHRRQLVEDIEFQASNALALGGSSLPFAVLAVEAADSGDKRKLELARVYVERGAQLDDKDVSVHVARAFVAARRGAWTLAYASAERAVALAPKSEQALRIGGLVAAHVALYDVASQRLAAVKGQDYEVLVARGTAARGLGDAKTAEKLYQQAIQLDGARPEAKQALEQVR